MYRTCLFCHADLGANQTLELLPIGRRIAFDQARGRLWVVCRGCERWNLTPFDERWETIEACERLFRETRLRFSTDEIGLGRLRDGTDLVRIGDPLRPEMAAWRYGDQFGRRRRRHLVLMGAGIAGITGLALAPALVGLSVGGGWLYQFANPVLQAYKARRVVARIPLGGVEVLPLTQLQVEHVRLLRDGGAGWRLRIPDRKRAWRGAPIGELAVLEGAVAHAALQRILPRVNHQGASKAKVQEAVRVLEHWPEAEGLAQHVASSAFAAHASPKKAGLLASLAPQYRLALEMSSHEEAERRWLAGELLELEAAWREAEEVAAISDRLAVPAEVEAQLERLRAGSRASAG